MQAVSVLRRAAQSLTKTGTVKSFRGGFGFATMDDGKEVFLHQTEIKSTGFRAVAPNTKVKFEVVEKDGKLRASQIRNLDDSPIVAPEKERSFATGRVGGSVPTRRQNKDY